MLNILLGTKAPSAQKKILKILYSRAVHAQMCVAPVGVSLVVLEPVDVAVTDVDAAHKAGFSVDHNDLAVVAIIEPVGKWYKVDSHEWKHLHAICPQAFYQPSSDRPAAKVVINKPDFNAFFSLLHQNLCYGIPYGVVFIYIVFYMNMMFGSLERFQYCREFLLPIYKQLHIVFICDWTHRVIEEQIGKFFFFGGYAVSTFDYMQRVFMQPLP